MGSYYSKDALCPYYQYDDPAARAVVCEGVLPGSTIRSRFPKAEDWHRHMKNRCCKDYKLCHWFRIASYKYGEKD